MSFYSEVMVKLEVKVEGWMRTRVEGKENVDAAMTIKEPADSKRKRLKSGALQYGPDPN